MKLRNLLPLAALALPAITAQAVPAYPGLLTVKNPDGTTLQIRAHGDEHFNYYTDADGKYVVNNDDQGFWRVVERDGNLLQATPANIERMRAEHPEVAMRHPMGVAGEKLRMAALDAEGRTTYQTIGEGRGLVILVEFADTYFSLPNIQQLITDFCNKPGFSEYGARGSARDYFMHVSDGKFLPSFDVSRVVRLSKPRAYYASRLLADSGFGELVYDSVTELDDEIDYSIYDGDKDGLIDNIFFLYAGFGQADTGDTTTIWPHQGHYYNYSEYMQKVPVLIVDGVKMATYACGNELKSPNSLPFGASSPWLDGVGTFTHEFGHVLGLPDLYDTEGQGTPTPKKYDIMDTGSYNNYSTCPPGYSAYEKWLCHWIELTDVEDGKAYEVPSHSTGTDWTAFRIPLVRKTVTGSERRFDECYIIETRTNDDWDSSMPADGMFIWHIDYEKSKWTNNLVNSNGVSRCMMMPSSSKFTTQYHWPGSNPKVTSTYTGQPNALVPRNYIPNFVANLTGIDYDPNSKTSRFEFNMVREAPAYAPEMLVPQISEDGKEIIFRWNAPEGPVQEYLLTVTRTNANGTVRIVDQCDDRSVGDKTNYNVRIPTTGTAAEDLYKAYVRVVNYLPSEIVSNEREFYLKDLLTPSGVDGIESGVAIYGGQGFIEAPADAEIYTMSGVRTGSDNLPGGIYIVRHNGRSVKVVVR